MTKNDSRNTLRRGRKAGRRASSLLLLAAAGATLAWAQGPDSAPTRSVQERDWEFVTLPTDGDQAPPGFPARFDGRHVAVPVEDVESHATLGEGLAPRAIEILVRSALEDSQPGGRNLDAVIDSLDGRLIVRGSAAARAAAREAVQSIERDLAGLRVPLRVRLLRTSAEPAAQSRSVIDELRVARSGERAVFGERIQSAHVTDFDVEVAQSQSIADPIVTTTLSGETVHLWVSTYLDADGERATFVQGLLDVAREHSGEPFETDLYEFDAIDQPIVDCVQVQFAGIVPREGPLRVVLTNIPLNLGHCTLEITRESTGFEADAPRIVDFARGLWRSTLTTPHALSGREDALRVAGGTTPGGAIQLASSLLGTQRDARPVLSESLAVLPASNLGLARELQAFAIELDPVGPPTTVLVQRGKFRAELPVHAELQIRVAVTRESVLTTEFDPQIANNAALADPQTEVLMEGFVFEGVARGAVLSGQWSSSELLELRVRESRSMDIGRMQLSTRRGATVPVRVEAGKSSSPQHDTAVSWYPTPPR